MDRPGREHRLLHQASLLCELGVDRPLIAGCSPRQDGLSFHHPLPKGNTMEYLAPLAFAGMTIVNLVVLGLVMTGIFRKTRVHH